MASLLQCLHICQLLNQTLLSSIMLWYWGFISQTFNWCFFSCLFMGMCVCVFLFFFVCFFASWERRIQEGGERHRESCVREWESWDETLTWSFLMVQKRPVSSEALLRLQRNAFLVFAPEELTDHWPVCSLSKDSCLCSFLIRTKALCD